MIDQRQAVKQLYNDPLFKSKFWEDDEVFNENTPLLKENIEQCYKNSRVIAMFTKLFTITKKIVTTRIIPK